MRVPIYLDNNATTRMDPRAVASMLPYFADHYGNAASKTHPFGWEADKAVQTARRQLAELIGARPPEIVFTSGATEANNMAILGSAAARNAGAAGAEKVAAGRGGHIVTSRIEHKAVIDPCEILEKRGYEVTYLTPADAGVCTAEQVAAALRPDTFLISLMTANNEIGSVTPIREIGALAHDRGILFHTDCAQGVGKIPIDVEQSHVDLLALSGHKFYGPKGVGALYVRSRKPRVKLAPIIFGGGQEQGLRPGTLNVPLIVGLGAAAQLCNDELDEEMTRLGAMAERLYSGLQGAVGGVSINGHRQQRLPGTMNLAFEGIESDALLLALPDVAASSGSACTTGSVEPSYVLRAVASDAQARSSVRFSVGRFNSDSDIDYAVLRVAQIVRELRQKT